MNTDAPTAQKLSPNTKLFLVIVAAIIVALAAFTIGKSLWDSHEASVAQAQAQMQEAVAQNAQQQAVQEKVETLHDLYYNKLGDPVQWADNHAKDGYLLASMANDLKGDWQKDDWASDVKDKPSTCSEVYPNQTQPMPGCDEKNADGTWTYSISLADAQIQLQDDVNSYNKLATQVDQSALKANHLPYQLDYHGNPVDKNGNSVDDNGNLITP